MDDRNQVAVASRGSVFEAGNDISPTFQASSYLEVLTERVASLAHEIRNPLASIKGVADAFLERGQLTIQEREWMEAVGREVLKIDARVRELLDFSQPRMLNLRECSLNAIVSEVVLLAVNHATSLNSQSGHQISVKLIDATTKPIVMSLDPAQIGDALLNLILNAVESIAEKGRVTVCLRTCVNNSNGNDEALIEVTDTGCGIPLEIRDRIFEPRFTTKVAGTGLGLPAVQRTAAAHHGRVNFRTRIGRGTKFVLALPLMSQQNLIESSP